MRNRREVSSAELLEILNKELRKFPQCEKVQFTQLPVRLRQPDESGCNWDQDNTLHYPTFDFDIEECKKCLPDVLEKVASEFNLKLD